MKVKIIAALLLVSLLATLAPNSTYATTTATTATRVYAVALSCPYHITISVQDGQLVVSGTAPDYIAGASLKVSLIKPVDYSSCSTGSDGRALVSINPSIALTSNGPKDLTDPKNPKDIVPTVVKTLTHTLTCTNDIAPEITVNGDLTLDLGNVPKLNLDSVPDGIYNLRVGLSTAPTEDYLYCDEIIIVVDGGKANLQLLPSYSRYITYDGACTIYRGYSLDKWDVMPATNTEDFDKWLRSRSGLAYSLQ